MLLHRDFLRLLPNELREHLLSYLDGKSLLTCCSVSKTWNDIISSSSRVWFQACKHSGLVVNKDIDNVDTMHWKTFFLNMTRRRHQMITYKSFSAKLYEKFLRRVTAVYYYKGKIATGNIYFNQYNLYLALFMFLWLVANFIERSWNKITNFAE